MSHRATFILAKDLEHDQNKRAAGVQARVDVTTTVYIGPTGISSTSPEATAPSVSIAAIAGGLAAGITLVVVAVIVWWCCARGSRKPTRHQRDRKLPAATQGKFDRGAWRAEDSFSLPQQKKDAFPASPTSPSSPHPLTHSPVIHVPLSPSNSSSSGEYGRRGSGESKYYDEESGYVGPEDLGYNTRSSSLPYNQSPPSSTKKSSVPESSPFSDSKEQPSGEDEEPLPSPRSARKARRRSMKQQRRDPPPPPLSPTSPSALSGGNDANGMRRYAPARPSPLAQAVYRNSALSPSPSPVPPPSSSAPVLPAPIPTYTEVLVQSPPNSPFADPADPFLDSQQSEHYHHHHNSRHYPDEDEGDRPVSGVGYAI